MSNDDESVCGSTCGPRIIVSTRQAKHEFNIVGSRTWRTNWVNVADPYRSTDSDSGRSDAKGKEIICHAKIEKGKVETNKSEYLYYCTQQKMKMDE